MILDQDQLDAIFSNNRNGLIDEKYRWPNKTVPYQLNSDHSQEHNDQIEEALRKLEAVSCLKFVRRTTEVDYIRLDVIDDKNIHFRICS